MTRLRALPLLALAGLAALASSAQADNPVLKATVGPGFTIALQNPDGSAVTNLAAGDYTIDVNDQSAIHDFHLSGPGVDQTTEVEFVGTTTWSVHLVDGTYTFVCDPHAGIMAGSFTVGTGAAPAPAPTPAPAPAPTPATAPRPAALVGTVGPGFAISLKTAAGAPVSKLPAGPVTITVRDRSKIHDFHLTGPGVNKSTAVPFVGTATWKLTLTKGRYRFACDPHASAMRGSFTVG